MTQTTDTHVTERQPQTASTVIITTEPFRDQPDDPKMFFADQAREQRLTLLHHLAPYSQVLLATGVKGVGKTALMYKFISRANESWRCAVVEATDNMEAGELAQKALEAFGQAGGGQGDMHRQLVAHFHALRKNAQTPLLLIDDAHHLSQSAFEFLLRLCDANDREHILSIILFGEPLLETELEKPALSALRSRIAHKFDIPPFTEQGTQQYIHFHLQMAGVSDWGQFTNEVVHKIHVASDGVPQWINKLAHSLYSEGEGMQDFPEPVSASSSKLSRKSWLGVGIAVLLVVVVILYTRNDGEQAEIASDAGNRQDTVAVELALPAADSNMDIAQTNLEEEKSSLTDNSKPSDALSTSGSDAVAAAAGDETAEGDIAGSAELSGKETEGTSEAAVKPAAPGTSEPVSVIAGAGPVERKPLQESAEAVKPDAGAVAVLGNDLDQKPGSMPSKNLIKSDNNGIKDAAWLALQKPESYTLQIMALKDEDAIRALIEKNGLQAKAAYFSKQHNGETLYVLIYGLYDSRADAEQDGKKLPASLRKNTPWVRNLKSIQSELK